VSSVWSQKFSLNHSALVREHIVPLNKVRHLFLERHEALMGSVEISLPDVGRQEMTSELKARVIQTHV
jgi:hypothetical protein